MIKKRCRTVILTLLFVMLMVALIPHISAWIKFPLLGLLSCVSLLSMLCIVMYYHSLPDTKKSILSYLVILLMFLMFPAVIWYLITAVALAIPSLMQESFKMSPLLTCSLLNYEYLGFALGLCDIAIVISKIFLIKDSLAFNQINHEKRFKQVAAFIFLSSTILIVLKLWYIPCTLGKAKRIQLYSGIQILVAKRGIFQSHRSSITQPVCLFISLSVCEGILIN